MFRGKRRQKANKLVRQSLLKSLIFGVSFLPFGTALAVDDNALPAGADVVGGQASFDYSNAGQLHVYQTSDRAVINWDSFNIGATALTQFHQNNSSSIAVNRVVGPSQDPTQILGTLKSNGIVMVLDRNGVLFGQNSTIDVGGILAATGDIDDAHFMTGAQSIALHDAGSTSQIINNANISVAEGGLAAFVAPQIINNGVINAKMGRVTLAAGDVTTLDLYGDGLVELAVDESSTNNLIENNGSILAEGGRVHLSVPDAKNIVDNVINMNGVINVSSATQKGGKIILEGGNIRVDGHLEANGKTGGGTIHIGGEYQGKGNIRNARTTVSSEDTVITANAIENGDGGEVIVWANDSTEFYGLIEAKGGAVSGDGGFVEVSGKDTLTYAGFTNTLADNGESGTLLLDPTDITISTAGDSANNVNVTTLETNLAGGNVTITTASADPDVGDIDVNDAVTWATNTRLTLNADNDININADIINTASGHITLNADTTSGTVTVNNNLDARSLTIAADTIDIYGVAAVDDDMSLTANTIYVPGAVNVFDILTMTASDFDIAGASTFGRFAQFRFAIDGTIGIGDNAVGADNTVTGRSVGNLTGQRIVLNDGGLATGDITIDHNSDIITDSRLLIDGNNASDQDININSNVDVNAVGANTFVINASNDINVSGVLSSNDDLFLEANRINVSGGLAVDDILIMTANHHDVSGSASYGRFGYIRFLSDGTVGIGNNATGEDFTVTGDTFSNMSGSGSGRMLFNDNGVVTQDILIDHSGTVSHGRRVTFHANHDPNQSIVINSDMSSDVELEFLTGTLGTLSFGGDVTLTAPVIDIDNATSLDIAGNDVTLAATSHQYTSAISSSVIDSGTAIFTSNNNAHSLGIDSAGSNVNFTSAGVLGLVDSTVDNIQVGNQSNIGGVNLGSGWGGLLSDNNVIARTGGDINMAGGSTVAKTTGADTNLTLIADDSITLASSSITSTLGELEVTLHADADNDDAGYISTNAMVITTNGGDFIAGGGLDPLLDYAWGTAVMNDGVTLQNTDITTNAGNISIWGHGRDDAATSDQYGLYLYDDTDLVTTTGVITFNGVGGLGTNNNHGVFLDNATTSIFSNDGNIEITGQGQGSGINNNGFNSDGADVSTTNSDITLISDTYNLENATSISSGNDLNVRARTLGASIGLGNGAGVLNLDNTELNFLDAAGIVKIGDALSNSTITIDNVDTTSSTFDLGIIGGEITVNNGLSSGGDVFLQSLTSEDIILNSIVRATGSGDTIVIATGDEVINNFGVGALDPDLGRFLIFAQSPSKITTNGLTAAERFGQSFSSLVSVSIPGINNNFVYAVARPNDVLEIRELDPYKAEEDVKEIIDKKVIQDSKEGQNAIGCLANYGNTNGACIISAAN